MKLQSIPPALIPPRSTPPALLKGVACLACLSLSGILSAHAADAEKRAEKTAQSTASATASAQAETPATPADPAGAKSGAKQTTTIASPGAPKPNPLPQLKLDNTPLPPNTPTYAPVVEKVSASVVTINTSQTAPAANGRRGDQSERNPLFDDPMIRRFFGLPDPDPSQPPQQQRRQPKPGGPNQQPDENNGSPRKREQSVPLGLGSGVIVSTDGYILTNNHVIDGADKLEVSLGKNGRKYVAKKIGGDVRTDIAVLKIDATDLSPITFADSDHLRAGDIVIAVGNPFNLTRSATMGVVSAVGRRDAQTSQMADLGNFIQTDAAINMGNSGGALVDYLGRLVGINTAIFSRTGGNQGIGFSVPSNIARSVMESLIKHGRVLRGFLGIGLQDLDESLQKEFHVEPGAGAVINEVRPGTPAAKAGLKEYDVITSVNDKKIEGYKELQLTIAALPPGTSVKLNLIRDKKPISVSVVLGEKPETTVAAAAPLPEPDPDVLDGVTVGDLNDATRQEFRVPSEIKGAVVTAVEPDSIAASTGIRPGDVIQEIKRRPISSADEAVKLSEELKRDKQVLLRVYSRGSSRMLVLESKP
jgi:serine protease Do